MSRSVTLLAAAVLMALAGLGCRARPVPVPAPAETKKQEEKKQEEEPIEAGPAPRLDAEALKFSEPDKRRRFLNFDAEVRRFAAVGFEHQPYRQGGNFVTAVWAKNAGFTEPIMLRGPRGSLKEIHRVTVDTIVIPFPKALSAALGVETVSPDPDGWCVSFSYREAAQNQVTGPGWGVLLYRWDPTDYGKLTPFRPQEQAKERIWLPLRSYAVRDSGVGMATARPVEEDFLRHARSAAAMRDAYLADLTEMEKRVVAFIEEHKARKKVYDKHGGGGVPPPHRLEALTADEEEAELAKAKRHFAAEAKLMREHHEAAYAAWRRAFPLERCWPQLAAK